MMLAAYFDQYPAHLAAAARRQAGQQQEQQSAPRVLNRMATPPQPPSEGGRTYTLTDASDEPQQQPQQHPSPSHQHHNNVGSSNNHRHTTPPPPPPHHPLTADTNELRPLKKPLPQEGREVEKGVSDEERRSNGTYCKVVPPPPASALSNNSKSLATSSTTGCPVHDPTHPQYRPPHAYAPSSSSGGSSRSSAADSQLLHCGICTQRYSNPKVLPCLHTFCERCLISYTPAESLTLTCPVCRQQSILPKDGVPGLQSNTWVRGVMEAMDSGAAGPPLPGSAPGPCALCLNSQPTSRCVQCHKQMCASCATRHTQDSGSESHSVVSLSDSDAGLPHANGYHDDETTLYCPSHQGQTLRFYCRDCETAVCSSCTDIEHRAHNTLHLTDAVEEHRLAMHQLIDRVTMQLPCVKESICDIQDVSRNLREKRTEAEKEIRRCFDILHELLDKRQTTLINSLNTIESEKQQTLDNQKEELEAWVCGVESGCEFVEKALAHCPAMEVVLVRKQLGERLMDYANMNVPPAPRENSHLKFVVGNIDPLKTAFLHVGSIQSNSAVPHQTSATGESLRQITVGRQAIVTVVTRDHKGEKASCGGAEVTAAISRTSLTVTRHGSSSPRASSLSPRASSKSPSGSREELCQPQVLDLNNGTYEVAFTVHGEGTYCLEVLLYGHPISGSPFSIAAIPPLEEDSGSSQRSVPPHTLARQQSHSTQVTSRASRASRRPLSHRSSCSRRTNPIEDDMLLRVGRRGRNRGEFVNPQGIAYNAVKDGRIAVADSNNQCIQVFTLAGECKLRFGVRGRSIGQMQRPTGVAALPNGNYVVADYENKWVSIFEPSGKFVTRIGHGKLLGPKGVCVDNNGHIIVVDNKASCVCIFQQSGKLLTKFGNRGTDEFQFAGPHFAAVNSMGHIVITDFHNHCVKVFDSDGDFLFTFGTSGEGNGQFNAPTGVAVDSNDNIIVADWGNSRIQVFDSQGSFLSYVNTLADPLYGPQGMTLTPDGQIFVADSGNHCFKVYKYLQ
ncbi:tripartite motif-containing protein 3-like isoform X3 [Macrobrachium nipponense]|uniref:tripartite motif-containing protein 3-like isoform X3 n=1 Tax=Macrobrachium nipponense TaxID=159736 RepID=UPI0030C8517A